MHAKLTNPTTGMVKDVKVGFSWTYFFFGFIAAAFRGDWKYAIITLFAGSATLGLFTFILSFFYNKLWVSGLIDQGYLPSSNTDKNVLVSKGYVAQTVKVSDLN